MLPKLETKPYNPRKTPQHELHVAHFKLDGHYATLIKDFVGTVSVFSSDGHDITAAVKGLGWLHTAASRLPNGCWVAGELHSPGLPAARISSVLASLRRGAADVPPLRYAGFAMGGWNEFPHAPGVVPADDAHLEYVHGAFAKYGLEFAPFIRINELPIANCIAEFPGIAERYKADTGIRLEGYVFKHSNLQGWYKWKPVKTLDAIATGFTDGKGQHLGLIGAVELAVVHEGKRVAIGTAGGFTKSMRVDISDEEENYIGKTCEIEYQFCTEAGKLRHGRFKRWRDDKHPQNCLSDQDPDLLEALQTLSKGD